MLWWCCVEEINVVMVLCGGNQCCDGFVWRKSML